MSDRDAETIETDIHDTLAYRAKRCVGVARQRLSAGEYFLGGGAIATREIHDIDVYPAGDAPFVVPNDAVVLAASKNATTIANDPPIQFCNYKFQTLRELIRSFDFAHIQAGAHIKAGAVVDVAWTDAFIAANACRTSKFTASAYPLSSAIRLLKYHKRGDFTRHSAIHAMLEIVLAVVKRGFSGYEDFKDQLDAVDLGLTPEAMCEVSKASLMELFELLRRDAPGARKDGNDDRP